MTMSEEAENEGKTREEVVTAAYNNCLASFEEELTALNLTITNALKRVRTIQETATRNALRVGKEEFGD